MGNEQSSGDGTVPQFRVDHPKFQRAISKGQVNANSGFVGATTLQSNIDTSFKKINNDNARPQSCGPIMPNHVESCGPSSSAQINLETKKLPEFNVFDKLQNVKTSPLEPHNVGTRSNSPLVNFTEEISHSNKMLGNEIQRDLTSTVSLKETTPNASVNYSPKKQQESFATSDTFSKTSISFKLPERDVRHVPLQRDSSSGNPFLPSSNKSLNDPFIKEGSIQDENAEKSMSGNDIFSTFEQPASSVSFRHYPASNINPDSPASHLNVQSSNDQDIRRSGKLAPRFQEQKQFKKNVSKGIKGNSPKGNTTLKDLEKLVEICNVSPEGKGKHSPIKSTPANFSDIEGMEPTISIGSPLEECILKMKNIQLQSKDALPFLQDSLCNNVETINNFISALKSFPILNEKLVGQINVLKENLSTFSPKISLQNVASISAGDLIDFGNSTPTLLSNKPDKADLTSSKVNSPLLDAFLSDLNTNQISPPAKKNLPSFELLDSLLKELPNEYQVEKDKVIFHNGNCYCTVCENFFPCALTNLVEHFKSKRHQKSLNGTASEKNEQNLQQKQSQKDNNEKISFEVTVNLGKKHQDILEMICTSLENNYVINKVFYICVACDFGTAEEHVATKHLTIHQTEVGMLLKNANPHFCNTCEVVVYGVDSQYDDHCRSVLHDKIKRIKTKDEPSEQSKKSVEVEDEKDDISICSSKSDVSNRKHMTPHEVLLLMAKSKKERNYKGLSGLYCQVCRRYYKYNKSTPPSERSAGHSRQHCQSNKYKNYQVFRCSTCNVELFGDISVWEEHISLEMHKELENIENSNLPTDSGSRPPIMLVGSRELSNSSGAHYDLMREVLMKHIRNEQSMKAIYGSYCDLCETYTIDENKWSQHLNNTSHSNYINSPDCRGRKMFFICLACKINMICEERVFILHQLSPAHEAVSRLLNSRNNSQDVGAEKAQVVTAEESEESEDDDDDSDSDNESTASSVANTASENSSSQRTLKGIRVTGLSPDMTQKDLFEAFKKFGFVTKCVLHKSGKSGNIVYRDMESIKTVLQKNPFHYIKGKKVSVLATYKAAKRPKKRKNQCAEPMNPSVVAALSSEAKLQKLAKELKAEVTEVGQKRTERISYIMPDIMKAAPQCKVHIFGSQFTGLATRDSDFDIYIDHNGCLYFTEQSQEMQMVIIRELLDKLSNPRSGFQVREAILEARVPILRVLHTRTGVPCDISVRSGLSMENSILTKHLLSSDFRVSWLLLVIKWWMKTNDLLAFNKFTSYTTTWLVVFFLMRVNVLSPLVDMRENCQPYSIGYWDCRFNREYVPSKHFKQNTDSRVKLLLDFFKLYSTFNFQNVVLCPLTASLIPRKHFEDLKLPPPFAPYVNKVRREGQKLKMTTPLCLQDPYDLSHNIAKGVKTGDLKKFKNFCQQSAEMCEKQGFK